MKRVMVFLAILILALTACSTTKIIKISETPATQQTQVGQPVQQEKTVNVSLAPEFKLIRQYGVRSPASISGTVRNIGLGSGTVKVTANVYYASVVSSAGTQELTIKPEEEENFSISIDKDAQWTSYSVKLEEVK
jgi:hypothetical protein